MASTSTHSTSPRGLISLLPLCLAASILLPSVNAHGAHHSHARRAQAQQAADSKYDFIVVGSGPGGGPLAANLAKSNFSVLLIEAGSDNGDDLTQQVPAYYGQAANNPNSRWDYFVKHTSDDKVQNAYPYLTWRNSSGGYYVGQNPPSGSKQLGVYYPRCGTLGGCSMHNAMAAVLPADSDWQYIKDITGDKTWDPKRMTKMYAHLEHNNYAASGASGHGFKGYLGMSQSDPSFLNSQPERKSMVAAAGAAIGNSGDVSSLLKNDINAPGAASYKTPGIFGFSSHIDAQGKRSDSRTYINDVLNAKNADGSKQYKLDVWTNTLVTRVVFDQSNLGQTIPGTQRKFSAHAVGVEYMQGKHLYSADPSYAASAGTKQTVTAKSEVIISAGVFNTPQILKLSGIGPADELTKLNIPVVADLPGVGANLQDNQEYSVVMLGQQNFTKACASDADCLAQWKQGKGAYTQGPADAAVMMKSSTSPDGQNDMLLWGQTQVFRGFWPQAPGAPADYPSNAYSMQMLKIHPRSKKGVVTLKSNNPQDTPDINFNFFADGEADDLQALADGVAFGRKVFGSVSSGVGPFAEVHPCNKASALNSTRSHFAINSTDTYGRLAIRDAATCDDATVKQLIKNEMWSHHATGTAAIGAKNDSMAVLNSDFTVMGTKGLRVVDASVFPVAPGSFPVLATFMVSEKATEVILLNEKKKARNARRHCTHPIGDKIIENQGISNGTVDAGLAPAVMRLLDSITGVLTPPSQSK